MCSGLSTACTQQFDSQASDSLPQRLALLPTPARSGTLGNNKKAKVRCSITDVALNAQACHSVCSWGNLPDDIKQTLMDWLPTYHSRIVFQMTCKVALRLDRNAVFDLNHMENSAGINVYLRDMRFGDRGAHAVAQALQMQRYDTVLRLNLGNNFITDVGALSIADAIMKSPAKIKRIYLDGNKISDIGARSLVKAAASHGTLLELDLRKNCLTIPGSTEVSTYKCKENSTVRLTVFLSWNLPSFFYMAEVQTDINERMRCILVDWLLEVIVKMENYRSFAIPDWSASYFLAISFIDRYLSLRPVARTNLQLVGEACLLIALRPDFWSPGAPWPDDLVNWLCEISDHCFTLEALKSSASDIRDLLLPQIQQPSVYDFYVRYVTWNGYGNETLHHGEYLLSLAVLSMSFLNNPPDVLAAAAVLLTHDNLDFRQWHRRLLRCSSVHATKELIPCARKLLNLHAAVSSGKSLLSGHMGRDNLAARKKYSSNKYFRVARSELSQTSLLFLERESKLEIEEQRGDPTTHKHDVYSDDVAEANDLEPTKTTVNEADWTLIGARRRSFPYCN